MSTKDVTYDESPPVVQLEIEPGVHETDNRGEAQRWAWSMAGWMSEQLAEAHALAMTEAMDMQRTLAELPPDEVFLLMQPEEEPS